MPRTVGFTLVVIACVWLFYVVASDILAVNAGAKGVAQAMGHALLVGVLPFLIVAGAAGALLAFWRKHEAGRKTFEYEQQVLLMVNKEGRLPLNAIREAIPLNRQQIRELLIGMGRKRLFTGYIDWKNQQVVSGEAAEVSPGECPVCGSLTSASDPHEAVCTRCEAYVFLPSASSRRDGLGAAQNPPGGTFPDNSLS